jgi:hypothetical protein
MWLESKPKNKDAHLQPTEPQCEMCTYKFRINFRTETKVSCSELENVEVCSLQMILGFFLPIVFFGGAFICGVLLVSILANSDDNQLSIAAICLIVCEPACLVIGTVFMVRFVRGYCLRKQQVIMGIEQYEGGSADRGRRDKGALLGL